MRVDPRERVRRLVEANVDDLFAYFARRVRVRDDAADLIGETMLVVWRRSADVPTDDTAARMWMFGIARRVLMNHERGRRRRSALADRVSDRLVDDLASGPTVDDFDELRTAVHALPPKQREVVLLVYGEGFTLAEASTVMRASASTTRSRHAYALAALRARVGVVLPGSLATQPIGTA